MIFRTIFAGGILDKNYTVATDIGNNQKLSLRTKGSSLLLFRAGEHPCAALLGLNGKGTVIVESKSNDVLFFQKDIPGKFCIFYDDTTQTFVVQNNYGDARTVTLRVIPFRLTLNQIRLLLLSLNHKPSLYLYIFL